MQFVKEVLQGYELSSQGGLGVVMLPWATFVDYTHTSSSLQLMVTFIVLALHTKKKTLKIPEHKGHWF